FISAQRVEEAAVKLIGSRLRYNVDLSSAGGAAFRRVIRGADAEFLNGIERDIQAGIGLLGLLLNTASVDTVKGKGAVVEGVAVKTDAPLRTVTIVDGAGCQQHQTGPVPATDGNLFDLFGFDYAGDFCRGAIHRLGGRFHHY